MSCEKTNTNPNIFFFNHYVSVFVTFQFISFKQITKWVTFVLKKLNKILEGPGMLSELSCSPAQPSAEITTRHQPWDLQLHLHCRAALLTQGFSNQVREHAGSYCRWVTIYLLIHSYSLNKYLFSIIYMLGIVLSPRIHERKFTDAALTGLPA